MTTTERCRWAIGFGPTLHTRCARPAGHGVDNPADTETWHEAKGLAQFPYQRIEWMPGDRREYESDRTDDHAWEVPGG